MAAPFRNQMPPGSGARAPIKVVLTGVENAGKTSILKVLDEDFVHVHHVRPTKGVERSTMSLLGLTIVRWDLGGQDEYRRRYLEDLEHHFGDARLLAFVVDVQEGDESRVEKMFEYFRRVAAHVASTPKDARPAAFVVLLHKFDPELLEDPATLSRARDLRERFEVIAGGEFDLEYYWTSVFDRATMVTVLSQLLLRVVPRREIIEDELRRVGEGLPSPALLVADSTPVVLGRVQAAALSDRDEAEFTRALLRNVAKLRDAQPPLEPVVELFTPAASFFLLPFDAAGERFFFAALVDRFAIQEPRDLEDLRARLEAATGNVRKVLGTFYGKLP
ncbi:MAG: hypothetical protein Kow0069_08160 [Promethearchaeota archaeon]